MTIGQIKAEALKIMNINEALNISDLDIGTLYEDPTYAAYIYSMNGAINRALDRFYVTGAYDGVERIESNTPDTTVVEEKYGVESVLVRIIPLYVVSEVFSMEEPAMAAQKRNEFEELLEGYLASPRFVEPQREVEIVEKVW